MNRIKITYIFLIIIYTSNILTNPATLDTSFNGTGLATISALNATITDCALQPDGKIVVCGQLNNKTRFLIARFNEDGTLDATFNTHDEVINPYGTDGYVVASFSSSQVHISSAITVDANGYILVAGDSMHAADNNIFITRYTPTGFLDTTFNAYNATTNPNGTNGYVITTLIPGMQAAATTIVVQPDGNILIGGWTVPGITGWWSGFVARYLPTGEVDPSFGLSGPGYSLINPTGSNTASGQGIALQNDGSILLCGLCTPNPNDPYGANLVFITRLNASGNIDTTFGTAGSVLTQFGSSWISNTTIGQPRSGSVGIQVTKNGNIMIIGAESNNNQPLAITTPDTNLMIARYTPTGHLDTTFNPTNTTPGSASLYVGPDSKGFGLTINPATNKISVVGSATINNVANTQFIARFNASGTLDTKLNPSGFLISPIIYNSLNLYAYVSLTSYQPLIQDDDKLIIIGQLNNNPTLGRYLDGLIPFSPISSIGLHGQNSNYISHFLMIDFYAQVITDPLVQAATIDSINAIITTYAQNYINQPNFNFINYLYLLEAQINSAQTSLIAIYPNSKTDINKFFVYINTRIATLNTMNFA